MAKALKKQKKALQKKILSVNNKGDKPNFIDTLNGYVSDEINKWIEEKYVEYFSLDHIEDIVKNLNTWEYTFIAFGNKEFTGTYTATDWKNKNEDLSKI